MKLKLSVSAVIKSLEAAIKAKTAEKAEKQKELDKTKKQCDSALTTIKKNFDSYKIERLYHYGNSIDVRLMGDFSKLTFPESVEAIERKIYHIEKDIAELEKNIRILKMSADEHVSTSVLTDIQQYL